mmetsp:Transcript_11348/g.23196  ORF Transcript_11348/g.23196 Transcript_11348/m.23196 type:complete len:220 (-) Transcript_11348:744-1403(-)
MDDRGPEEADEANLVESLGVGLGGLSPSSVEVVGLGAVGHDNVKSTKESGCAVLLDRGVVLSTLLEVVLEHRRHLLDVPNDVVAEHLLDVGVRGSHGHGVGLEGGAPAHGVLFEELHHLVADGDHGNGCDTRAEALGASDDVRNDAVVPLESPHVSGPAEPNHDLIEVEEDVVLVAKSADALHVTIREGQDTRGARNTLEHDARNVVSSLVEDLFLKHF